MKQFDYSPKPVMYDGYTFRSTLEARWAYFFNRIKLDYLYEPQFFSLDTGNYLPDFFIPKEKLWLEVKGKCPNYVGMLLGSISQAQKIVWLNEKWTDFNFYPPHRTHLEFMSAYFASREAAYHKFE